jgi:RNA polymerase sigma factor (sigma-70 family)
MQSSSGFRTHPSLLGRLGDDPYDAAAWSEFVRRYGGLLYHWCREWRLQPADAEDVTQNILIRIARQIAGFRYDPARRFRSWLRTVAYGAWCDWLDEKYRPDRATGDSSVLQFLHLVEAREDLLKRLDEEFDRELVEIASERIRLRVQPTTWEAFRLQAFEGLSGAETAERLSINVGAAFVARSRVHKMMQEAVRELSGDPAEDSANPDPVAESTGDASKAKASTGEPSPAAADGSGR